MNSEQPFLEAICREPDNVALRLLYADWLDERDDPLGEFVRLQCELVGEGIAATCFQPGGSAIPEQERRRQARVRKESRDRSPRKKLLERMLNVFILHTPETPFLQDLEFALWRRGAVEAAGMAHVGTWKAKGPLLAKDCPIMKVGFSNAAPWKVGDLDVFVWYVAQTPDEPAARNWLPNWLHDQRYWPTRTLEPYGRSRSSTISTNSRKYSYALLSFAAIQYARDKAGLPLLPFSENQL